MKTIGITADTADRLDGFLQGIEFVDYWALTIIDHNPKKKTALLSDRQGDDEESVDYYLTEEGLT